MKIRPHTPTDLPALHAIRSAAFSPDFPSFRAIAGLDMASLGFAMADWPSNAPTH